MFSVVLPGKVAVASILDSVPRGWQRVDCRPLIDGPGNSRNLVDKVVTAGLAALSSGSPICFVCDYGRSRSNYAAALAISSLSGEALSSSLDLVRMRHPESQINPSLLPAEAGNELSLSQRNQRTRVWGITGSHGVVGTALSKELSARGCQVAALSRVAHGEYLDDSEILGGLLRSQSLTDLVHLAYPKPYNSYSSMRVSFAHLVNIVEACVSMNVRLHFISGWVVFDGSDALSVDEDSDIAPHGLYGQSKAAQEQFIKLQREHQGLEATVYRLPGLLSQASLEPRFLRYFADCIRHRAELLTHCFRNGSATVPLADLNDFVPVLGNHIESTGPDIPLIHVVGNSECMTVASIAQELALVHGLLVKDFPVDRVAFHGQFKSMYAGGQGRERRYGHPSIAAGFVGRLLDATPEG